MIGDDTVVPYLLAALEDDHALRAVQRRLGRLRAAAKEKLALCQQGRLGIKRCGAARGSAGAYSLKDRELARVSEGDGLGRPLEQQDFRRNSSASG